MHKAFYLFQKQNFTHCDIWVFNGIEIKTSNNIESRFMFVKKKSFSHNDKALLTCSYNKASKRDLKFFFGNDCKKFNT